MPWVPGTGDKSIVLIKEGGPFDADHSDGRAYTADAVFGTGAEIGTGNYVVFSGPGDTVMVTGLSSSTAYYVAVYEYSLVPPSEAENYLQKKTRHGQPEDNQVQEMTGCKNAW